VGREKYVFKRLETIRTGCKLSASTPVPASRQRFIKERHDEPTVADYDAALIELRRVPAQNQSLHKKVWPSRSNKDWLLGYRPTRKPESPLRWGIDPFKQLNPPFCLRIVRIEDQAEQRVMWDLEAS
jgi:hypothetical protein